MCNSCYFIHKKKIGIRTRQKFNWEKFTLLAIQSTLRWIPDPSAPLSRLTHSGFAGADGSWSWCSSETWGIWLFSQSFDFLGLNAGISGIFGGDGLTTGFGCAFLKGGISGMWMGGELTRSDELDEPLNWNLTQKLLQINLLVE